MALWSSQTTHTDISDFSDNPHLRRELRVWRQKIAASVTVVLTVVGFSSPPAYRAYREHRIDRNLAAAQEAARLQDWGTARDKARSVLLAREGDFEAFRVWTRALGKMGEPRTYMAAATLFTDKRATEADRLECLQVMAVQAPQAVALSAYASLEEKLRNRGEFRAAITPLLVSRGELAVAEKGLREELTADSGPAVRLELLRTLCAQPTAENVAEARGIFAGLVKGESSREALAALLILGETPGAFSPSDDLPSDLPGWVRSQAGAETLHHLLALHPMMEDSPDAADRAIGGAIERFQGVDPGILGTWLVRHGRAGHALTLLEGPAKTRGDAFIARLHALLRENRETELVAALKEPPASADMVEVETVSAVLARRRGDAPAATAAWTRALNQASFDTSRNRFIEIARMAQAQGAAAASEDAWVGAIRSGWGPLPLYEDLLQVIGSLAAKGKSEDLLAVCRTLQRYEPHHPDLANNVNYLGLLHGIFPPREVGANLEALLAAHPEMPEIHSAIALAELMDGAPEAAVERLPQLRGSKRVSPMMLDALEGSGRLLSGQTEAGIALLKTVQWKLFMRQERIVFRDLLIRLRVVGLPLPELEVPEVATDPDEIPAWRKAVEKMGRDRSADVLPDLPAPRLPDLLGHPEKP